MVIYLYFEIEDILTEEWRRTKSISSFIKPIFLYYTCWSLHCVEA